MRRSRLLVFLGVVLLVALAGYTDAHIDDGEPLDQPKPETSSSTEPTGSESTSDPVDWFSFWPPLRF